ncbi:30S ribosomal protein S3 [Patescibacteria group bacterium]|nr:30S ribosomal protein S3 [Patescibacteria group bacterium]MBU1705860.1 30S ribosomal protein S3 [Patescibacteria group bacterium]
MGHKVHPKSFRLGVTRSWDGIWFAKSNYASQLKEDVQIREFLLNKLKEALVDRIEIERSRGNVTVSIHSAKPGIIIGRAGAGIEELNKELKKKFYRGRRVNLNINVKEVQKPSLSARIVAQQIAFDLEKRMPFRRVMKMAIERVLKANAEGVKVTVKGRLNGAEIARSETIAQGKIPLHNLRADIDFVALRAWTTYGTIGVRVWINRGEVFEKVDKLSE